MIGGLADRRIGGTSAGKRSLLLASYGFTLVEVVVVLALLGIMAAVAVPAFRSLASEDDLTRSANEVAAVLRSAHMTALQRGIGVTVLLDAERGRYWIESEADSAWSQSATGTFALAAGVVLSADAPRIRWTFDWFGAGNREEVAVRSGTDVRLVGVDQWTGETYVRAP